MSILDPEHLHHAALVVLRLVGYLPRMCVHNQRTVAVWGIEFPNPVGMAAGFDKDGTVVRGLEALGFGFVEVGTVTQYAQPGNPRPRLFRRYRERAIVNRMGFNNRGADALRDVLARTKRRTPLGISIGKSKATALADAPDDYLHSFRILYEYGDYFVINVSSPNTPGLRTLQDKDALVAIVSKLNAYRDTQAVRRPLLVKVAPDLTDTALDEVVDVALLHKLDGVVATNTLATPDGGLSGAPLKERATAVIRRIHARAPTLPIIGVGGIFTAQDAQDKLNAGATLVQVYSGFIYRGPFIARSINRGLIMFDIDP